MLKLLATAVGISLAGLSTAFADTIRIAYQPLGENVATFVAYEEGFFADHGLEVELVEVQLAATQVQGLMAGSLEIGSPAVVTLAQAAAAGLDLVGISGMSTVYHEGARAFVMASTRSGIEDLEGLVGRNVAVAGLNGQIDVMLRHYLSMKGVDPESMTLLEMPFPAQPDALQSGAIDATLTVDPFVARIEATGIGKTIGEASLDFPEGIATAVYATRRDWAEANEEQVAALVAAVEDAETFIAENPDQTREYIAKYTNLPPQVVAMVPLARPDAAITVEHVAYWVDAMKGLGMLPDDFEAESMIFIAE